MPINPEIGEAGGQQYDVARAIRTFLGQMVEGGINVAAAVIKELLQNADDGGATEVHVVLDERVAGDGIPPAYGPLLAPALLVRNNAPFRLKSDVGPHEKDDFTAICDVASGHKRAQATAAGRFGIGFNSVYFLTDTPVLFSRREVHVFDLLHHIFAKNGWRFPLDEFPADAGSGAGAIKMVLERAIPKVALGSDRTFGQLAGEGGDYEQAILRLPLRLAGNDRPFLHPDRFAAPADRLAAVEAMAQQAARSVLFLKRIEKVSFGRLTDTELRQIAQVTITPPTPEFTAFVEAVDRFGQKLTLGDKLTCGCERRIRFVQWEDGAEKSSTTWSFYLKHVARFDDAELLNLRQRLDRNDEKAIPWASLAVPLDEESLQMDGTEVPSWRVFLPLLEPGPCACLVNAALFVGPSRQRVEFRLEGSDEANRKTDWNKQLIARGVVPLMHDASEELLDLVPGLIQSHPKEYLSLFPIATDAKSPDSLVAYLQRQFAQEAWCLRIYDIWHQPIEILVGGEDNPLVLDMVPEWAVRYGRAFEHLSTERRRFIPWAFGEAIWKRLGKGVAITFNRGVVADVAAAILGHVDAPEEEHLARLIRAIVDEDSLSTDVLAGLWAFRSSRDGKLLRYDAETLYVVDQPDQESQIHRHLSTMGVRFAATEWVSSDVGLVQVNRELTRAFENVRSADDTTAIELLERIAEGQGHDSLARADAIAPLVDFLLEVDPVRLSNKLRLAFMVRTASNAHDRRAMGVLLLKPEPASPDDNAVWQVLLRRAFAQVDPGFATELGRLIHGCPQLLPTLASDDCGVAVASAENSFDILHAARMRCRDRFARLADIVNSHASSKEAAEASLAILDIAERRWAELTDEQRGTVLATPIHRLANGSFVALCDAAGEDAGTIARRFRLQSEDDIHDAPISLPECQLLHSGSRQSARFYRRTLGLEEHGRAAVLKDSLRQIGGAHSDNFKLLQYLAKHFGETVSRLSESTEPAHNEDASEMRRLLDEAKLVPCLDGEWRSATACVDGREVAEYLRKHGWEERGLPDLVKELFLGMHVALLKPAVWQPLRDLGCRLPTLESRVVSQRAISSESPRLSLSDRVKLLVGCPADWPQEVFRAAVLDDETIPSSCGKASLPSVELLNEQVRMLPAQLLRQIAPRAVDITAVSQEWGLPPSDVERALRALRVPVADVNAIYERLTKRFAQAWSALDERDRLSLLAHVALHLDLEQALSGQLQSHPTVLVGTKTKEWKKPDQVVAPKWLATQPPHLLPDQNPAVGDVPDAVIQLWNRTCGINSLNAILSTVVEQIKTHRREAWRPSATILYDWLDRLSSAESVNSQALVSALREVPWVLSRKGGDLRFLSPADVIIHDGADVLSQRFWVPACPLPRCAGRQPFERFGFVTSPLSTADNLQALADCLQGTAVSGGVALCSIYQLVVEMVSDDDHLKELWSRIACERPVYHLFRNGHGPVSQMEVFLGEEKFEDDYGNVLFCLTLARQRPKGLVKAYSTLGVEERPSPEQALFALRRIAGSQKQLRSAYRGLIDILLSGPDLVPGPEFRVPACSGTYEPVERCFWSDGFGHSKRITAQGRKYLIDVGDTSARRLMDWFADRDNNPISRLESVARRELARAPDIVADNPAAQQILGPWRDLLAEVHRDGSILQDETTLAGIGVPAQPIEISLARGIRVRFVVPDGNIIEQDDGWDGPLVVHDGDCRVLVAEASGTRNYIGAADDLEALHQAIADEVVALLRHDSHVEPRSRLAQQFLDHLDRPTVTLERMRNEYQEHFFHQYHDQVADPEFAALFEKYRRTKKGTVQQEQLQEGMQRILTAQYVNARREQIRGYGYDTFSVFAELLQNAEDAYWQRRRLGMVPPPQQTVSFCYIGQTDNGCELVVEHFGRPFNYWRHGERQDQNYSRDVEGVLRSAGSFKPHGAPHAEGDIPIGRFGLGFKSVYLITDRPRIHSGFWHFAIEASCLPIVIPPPASLPPEGTRIALPLRDHTQEFRDETGGQLLNLVPFLREVNELTLQNSDGVSRTLRVSAECRTDLGDGMSVERIAICGVDHVRGGTVRIVRLRHAKHAGQIGVYLAEDGQPSGWSEAFARDMFVSLPLSAKLGCGIAVSHRFEIQSGRTHLISSENNADRIEEVGRLLRTLPDGLAVCAGDEATKTQLVSRFWGLWRWDSGDSECQELRKRLAAELLSIPQYQPFVPTLDGRTCVSFERGPVFYFDGIPEKVRQVILDTSFRLALGPHSPTPAASVNFASDSFVQAYQRMCRFAGNQGSENFVRVDWQVVGASCREHPCLADSPQLLNAIAESLPKWKEEQILEWLPHCLVRGRNGRGHEIEVFLRELVSSNFPGAELLPRKFLKVLDGAYSQSALDLLCSAGLLRRPSASQLSEWIVQTDLSPDDANAILRYLVGERRFMDADYRQLDRSFALPWFPCEGSRLSSAEACAKSLIATEVLHDSLFASWLGISETPSPPLPPDRLCAGETTEWLNRLFDWWRENREDWTKGYEQRVYPHGTPYAVSADFRPNDLRDRQEWLCLFLTGALHTMGRQQPEQHAGFLRLCERKGWLDVFADPLMNAANWMRVLEEYLEEKTEEIQYYQWMSQFVRIYHLARWLPEYVKSFLAVNRAVDGIDLTQVLTPAVAPMFQGGGPSAPPINRALGIGACFVTRELTRHRVLNAPCAWRYCFVPSESVRRVLWIAGCDAVANSSCRGVVGAPVIYEFLELHLGHDKATFHGDFDLPLMAVAEGAGPADMLPQSSRAVEMFNGR